MLLSCQLGLNRSRDSFGDFKENTGYVSARYYIDIVNLVLGRRMDYITMDGQMD